MRHYAKRLQGTVRILRVLTLKNQMKPHVTRPHVQLELQLHFPWISPWKRCTLHEYHWYSGCRKKLMPLEEGFLWEGKLKKRVGREPMKIDEKNWECLIFTLLMTCWLWKLSGKGWTLSILVTTVSTALGTLPEIQQALNKKLVEKINELMNRPEYDNEAVTLLSLLSDTKGIAIHPENAEVQFIYIQKSLAAQIFYYGVTSHSNHKKKHSNL